MANCKKCGRPVISGPVFHEECLASYRVLDAKNIEYAKRLIMQACVAHSATSSASIRVNGAAFRTADADFSESMDLLAGLLGIQDIWADE